MFGEPQARPLSTLGQLLRALTGIFCRYRSDKNRGGAAGEQQGGREQSVVLGGHTILQLLVLGEGPIWEHSSSSERCPGVLQHLKEPHLG